MILKFKLIYCTLLKNNTQHTQVLRTELKNVFIKSQGQRIVLKKKNVNDIYISKYYDGKASKVLCLCFCLKESNPKTVR